MNSIQKQKTTSSSHKFYLKYQQKEKNINLNKSSKKKYNSKNNNSNLDKYSSANELGELYNVPKYV